MIRPAFVLLLLFTLLTGVLYPLSITVVAQLLFPASAKGSIVKIDNTVVGSSLLAQQFTGPRYFWPRPSATTPPYNSLASAGANLSPRSDAWLSVIKQRIAELKASNPAQQEPIPVDLVTASGSGLDPHISVKAALWQLPRIMRARNLSNEALEALVRAHTQGPQWGVFGQERVNVLELNLALDKMP